MSNFIFINYVSEHQLSHAVNAFILRLLHVSIGVLCYWKLIGWRHCPCF